MEEYVLTEMQGAKVIINPITKDLTKYAQNYGEILLGWQCVILEFPNRMREYALYNAKGQLIVVSPKIEVIGAKIDIEKNKMSINKGAKKCRI